MIRDEQASGRTCFRSGQQRACCKLANMSPGRCASHPPSQDAIGLNRTARGNPGVHDESGPSGTINAIRTRRQTAHSCATADQEGPGLIPHPRLFPQRIITMFGFARPRDRGIQEPKPFFFFRVRHFGTTL